jgi:hypothetical protein
MPTGEPEWKHFDPKRDIAHDELYSDVFDYFINLRRQLMEADPKTSDDEITKIAKQGCYIAYYAQLSWSDPAAEIESRSLLNWHTMPPPALWIFAGKSQYNKFENNHLLSWIPPEYAEYAREAVNVAPDECIVDAESDFYQSKAKDELVKLGLIAG